MTVYWLDPWATSSGSGTYASPYSPYDSTRPTYSSGDELRIKSKLIADIVDSGTDTVTLGRTYTSGSNTYVYRDYIKLPASPSLTYSQYDVVYFPDYGTFAKIMGTYVSGSDTYLTVNRWGAPIPLNDTTTTFTIQKVNSAYFNVSSSYRMWISEFSQYNGVNLTVSDGWTSETAQTTDGTAVSLFCTSYTSYTFSLYVTSQTEYSGYTEYPDPSTYGALTCNMGNSVILCTNDLDQDSKFDVYFLAEGSWTLRQADLGGQYRDSNPNIRVAPEGLDFTLTVDTVCANGGISVGGDGTYPYTFFDPASTFAEYVIDFGNCYGQYGAGGPHGSSGYQGIGRRASKFSNLTYSFDASYSTYINSSCILQVIGHNNVTMNVGPMYVSSPGYFNNVNFAWSSFVISGDLTVNYSTSPAFTMVDSNGNTPTMPIAYKSNLAFGSTYQAEVDNMAKHVIADLPSGFTSSSDFWNLSYVGGFARMPYLYRGVGMVANNTFKPTLRMPSVAFSSVSSGSFDAGYYGVLNLIMSDGSYATADAVRTSNLPSILYFNKLPWITLDTTTFRTDGPSLKMQGCTSYDSDDGSAGGGHRITFGVTSGTTYSISGYVRTDRSGMATGDSVVGLYDENGNKISSASLTSSAYNAWEQFTFSTTASRDGEMSLYWYCEFDTTGQNYWLDDLEIST